MNHPKDGGASGIHVPRSSRKLRPEKIFRSVAARLQPFSNQIAKSYSRLAGFVLSNLNSTKTTSISASRN